jgi:hypothetical protein
MVWPIALYVLAMRRPGPGLLFAAGIAGGLAFYTYYSSRAAMPILALFVLSQFHWRCILTLDFWRDQIVKHSTLVLGFVLGAGPIFAASGAAVITQMFKEVPGGYSAEISGPPGERIWTNLWMNGPAVFYNTHVAHYISGPLLDPLTGALAALGIGLAVRHHRHPGMRLLLIWVVVASAATGLLSPHRTTAITRLHVVIPPLALLGAFAARQAWDAIPWARLTLTVRHRASVTAAGALLAVVLVLNLHRFWVATPTKLHLSQSAVTIGALRSPLCDAAPSRGIVLIRAQGLLEGALNSYRPATELPRFIAYEQLRPGQPIALDGARCIVFGDPNEDAARRAIDDLQRAYPSGQLTPFRDFAGIGTVMVFTPGPVAPRQ